MSLNPELFPIISAVKNDAQRPFWSVLVPAYKPQYLAQALRSVLEQAPGAEQMEIIVVDDCSLHALEPIVREVAGDRAIYMRHENNLGTYATQNTALNLSRGIWTHVLNDDDWVRPGFYSTLQKSLENQPPAVGVACCGYVNTDANGNVTWTAPPRRPDPGLLKDWLQTIAVSNVTHPISVVVRRSTHERVGGYCPALKYVADWEFIKRAAIYFDCWYEPAVLACYREHANNASREATRNTEMIDEFGKAIDITAPYLPPQLRQNLVARSRQAYAKYALGEAERSIAEGDPTTTLRLIQAGLRLSTSPAVLQNLVVLLGHPAAQPLRELLPEFFQRIQAGPAK